MSKNSNLELSNSLIDSVMINGHKKIIHKIEWNFYDPLTSFESSYFQISGITSTK
jgi:hypothetical protein